MRYYIMRSEGSRRFGPYQVRRREDQRVMGYAADMEQARELAEELEIRDRSTEDLPPLIVHRQHVAEPVDDRLAPRPWRP